MSEVQNAKTSPSAPTTRPLSGRIVSHYRVDPRRSLLSAFALGGIVMWLGSWLTATAFMGPEFHPREFEPGAASAEPLLPMVGKGVLGLALMALGGGLVFTRLRRELGEENYIALLTDGVRHQTANGRLEVSYDELMDASWDEARQAIVLLTRHDEERVITGSFVGVEMKELAREICQTRRKALFGLL